VPGADNIAITTPKKVGLFEIRCAELCGLWHGWMYAHGHVVTPAGFRTWIHGALLHNAPSLRYLPKFARVYYPDPIARGG
jgi:cytochrome c oxidase subunit 2